MTMQHAITTIDNAIDAVESHADLDALSDAMLGLAASSLRGDVGREYASGAEAKAAYILACEVAWERISRDAGAFELMNATCGGES